MTNDPLIENPLGGAKPVDWEARRGADPEGSIAQVEGREITRADPERKATIGRAIDNLIAHHEPSGTDRLLPYLLIRAFPGDHGVRQPPLGTFWESPDILVVAGIVDSLQDNAPTLTPTPGMAHTIFVRMWNLGRLPAIGVALRVWWANPAFAFDDPQNPPNFIAGMYVDLGDRTRPNASRLVRLPVPWVPSVVNNGHECLLAKIESILDPSPVGFQASTDRHVGQRNLSIVAAGFDLDRLFSALSGALPIHADLEFVDATKDLPHVVAAYAPDRLAELRPASGYPDQAVPLPHGGAHLGAFIRRRNQGSYFIPPRIATEVGLSRLGSDRPLQRHPGVIRLPSGSSVGSALMEGLGLQDLRASTLASRLSGTGGGAHLVRLQAVAEGRTLGGYSVVIL
jgi:hypothetical protein